MVGFANSKIIEETPLRQSDQDDLAFLEAWEKGQGPRSIDAATVLRVRQIRRVNDRALQPVNGKIRDR
jgi:hypothetical protein